MTAAAFSSTHGADALLFPVGVRLSTWVGLAAFLVVWLVRRDRLTLLAAAAWFVGFEAAYQAFALTTGEGLAAKGLAAPLMIVLGVIVVAVARRHDVHPSGLLMVVVAAVWTAWVAIGFPANGPSLVGLNRVAEALNEAAKTLWAAAYLLPFLRRRATLRPGSSSTAYPRGQTVISASAAMVQLGDDSS